MDNEQTEKATFEIGNKLTKKALLELIDRLTLLEFSVELKLCKQIYDERFGQLIFSFKDWRKQTRSYYEQK